MGGIALAVEHPGTQYTVGTVPIKIAAHDQVDGLAVLMNANIAVFKAAFFQGFEDRFSCGIACMQNPAILMPACFAQVIIIGPITAISII